MKLILAPILLLALYSTSAFGNLRDDLSEFTSLLPVDDLRNLTRFYWHRDAGTRRVFRYALYSKISRKAYQAIGEDADVKGLVEWVKNHINGNEEPSSLDEILGVPTGIRLSPENRSFGGFPTYVKKVSALLPHDKLEQLAKSKLSEGGDFAELFNLIKGHQETYERIVGIRSVRENCDVLRWLKVDVDAVDRFIRKVFEWKKE